MSTPHLTVTHPHKKHFKITNVSRGQHLKDRVCFLTFLLLLTFCSFFGILPSLDGSNKRVTENMHREELAWLKKKKKWQNWKRNMAVTWYCMVLNPRSQQDRVDTDVGFWIWLKPNPPEHFNVNSVTTNVQYDKGLVHLSLCSLRPLLLLEKPSL